MKIGTKTILFGGHQFLIHPVMVLRAWIAHFGWPNLEQLVAIVIHDWGYWGCSDLEGERGKLHPEWGSQAMCRLFGEDKYVAGHSRSYTKMKGIETSKLCIADKYCWTYYPVWLMASCAIITGEIDEYLLEATEAGYPSSGWVPKQYPRTWRGIYQFYEDMKIFAKEQYSPDRETKKDNKGNHHAL